MNTNLRAVLGTSLLGVLVLGQGCATDRAARNGVFNENQYVRKDFLTQAVDANGDAVGTDPGWIFRATVTETSTPNLMGSAIGVWGGAQGPVDLVRFRVTQDKLQLLSTRQFSVPVDSTGVTGAVANAWPATSVDLKYRVNLDGERTNFYEENQELDWQQRQYVKLNFAKNDFSDFAPIDYMGYTSDLLAKCADVGEASATLVTDSFKVEGQDSPSLADDYMEFTVQVAVPMKFDDAACIAAYGPMVENAARVERSTVTANLKYSFKRADSNPTYKPFPIDEKDKIHRKYGPFLHTTWNRDQSTGLIAAQQYVGRFDPAKDIVWVFDDGFPERYKKTFTDPGGIVESTNKLLTAAGTTGRLVVKEKPAGVTFGDVRYNFLRWVSDQDMQDTFAGVTEPGFDPRSGEIVNETVEMNDFAVRDHYVQRIDFFLQQIGASQGLDNPWNDTGACTEGQTKPIVNATLVAKHNASSTVFAKMQTYLGLHTSDPSGDHMGVQDMVYKQDADFMSAYQKLAPYELFADPAMNQFVTAEVGTGVYGPGQLWSHLQDQASFHGLMSKVNKGETPFAIADGKSGVLAAAGFMNDLRKLMTSRRELEAIKRVQTRERHIDAPDPFSLESVMLKDALRCVNGKWETKDEWIQSIIDGYWTQVIWHEFGHSLGLEHNFMGSIDQKNFPTAKDAQGNVLKDANGKPQYSTYTSSIMEYNAPADRLWWTPQWGPYDMGAIAWMYANDGRQSDPAKDAQVATNSLTGQLDASYPYKDPMGFDAAGKVENEFLRCDETHLQYSPLCQQGDLGVTPSQIIANAIDRYEWEFAFRNFRGYHKSFSFQKYADDTAKTFSDMRRFLAMWGYDWGTGEIKDTLHKIGVLPPADAPSQQNYYSQLAQKFDSEMSTANRLVAAFHQAVVAQSSGERPFATIYDKYYGDEVQQGIIIDKLIAMQQWVGLWPGDNYDQNQAGFLFSSFATNFGDSSYQAVSEATANFMIGGSPAAYAYFNSATVALFAQDTHDPSFLTNWSAYRTETKDWIGGWSFNRQSDLIDFFKSIAVANGTCTKFVGCTYDATDAATTHADPQTGAFTAPDGLTYNVSYLPSRNQWVVARKDRNVATWGMLLQYNTAMYGQHEDGTNGAYALEYQIKLMIDAYVAFESP
jgi:hypothetical protein